MKADPASFPLIRLLRPGLSFCRVPTLGVVSPVLVSSRPGPERNSLGRQPASLTGWSCCFRQFRYAEQLIKGHSEQRNQQKLLRIPTLRRSGWSGGMVPSMLCLPSAPLHCCGFAIASHKKFPKTPLFPGRTEPTPPAASLQLPAGPSLS